MNTATFESLFNFPIPEEIPEIVPIIKDTNSSPKNGDFNNNTDYNNTDILSNQLSDLSSNNNSEWSMREGLIRNPSPSIPNNSFNRSDSNHSGIIIIFITYYYYFCLL